MKNIKAPDELKARTRAAVREEKSRARQPVRSMRGGMKRLLAAACAFAVVLGGAALHGRQTGSDPVTDIAHTFGLVAYAADTGEMRQPKDSKIVFDTGSGADDPEKGFYSGCLFKVTGENIKTVSATIDRGAVYRTKTVKDTSADRDEWVRTMYQGTNPAIDGADRIMVWGTALRAQSRCTPTCAGSWTTASPTSTTRTSATVCGCPAGRRARTTIFRTRGISRWTALRARS